MLESDLEWDDQDRYKYQNENGQIPSDSESYLFFDRLHNENQLFPGPKTGNLNYRVSALF